MSPRPFRRAVAAGGWWLASPRYVRYMAREASCIFIGAYTAIIVTGLVRLAEGPAAWEAFRDALQGPAGIAFHLLALVFALYHTTTWFNVTPRAMPPVEFGGHRLSDTAVIGAHYAGWAVFSALVLVLAGA